MKHRPPHSFFFFSVAALVGCASEPTAANATDAATSNDAANDAGAPLDGSIDPVDARADAGDASDGGSTCVAHATCPGAPLVPPASLVTAMTDASPGDVVSLAGMNEGTAPCLAVDVCVPVDAPTLLFSDSPEMPSADGVLYADTVKAGRYRLYVYHANGGASQRKFPVVVLNQGASAAKVKILRRGLAAASKQYVSVGKAVLLDWLADEALPDVVVPAGERVLLDAALDAIHAGKDELVHAIFDVETDATLKLSFVSVGVATDAVSATAGLSLLPRDVDHQRGTFADADVVVTAIAGAQAKGVQHLRFGKDEIDATMIGVDATTGDVQKLLGNYGMLYRVKLGVPTTARAGLAPRGGPWGGVANDVPLPANQASLGTTTDAIVLGDVGPSTEVRLMTAGGSNLPVDLFLVTP